MLRQGCGTKLAGVGYLKIAAKDGAMKAGVMQWNCPDFNAAKLYALDTDITRAVVDATAEMNAALAEVVARSEVELTVNDPVTGVRHRPQRRNQSGRPLRRRVPLCFRRGRCVCKRRRHPREH